MIEAWFMGLHKSELSTTTVSGCIRTWDTSRRMSLRAPPAERRHDEVREEEPAKNDARSGP